MSHGVRAPEDRLSQSPPSIAGSRSPSHPCPTMLVITQPSRAREKKVACPQEAAGRRELLTCAIIQVMMSSGAWAQPVVRLQRGDEWHQADPGAGVHVLPRQSWWP